MRRTCFVGCMGLAAGLVAAGDRVYDNLTDQTGAFQSVTNFDPTLAIVDDLRIEGGGELEALTFTYGYTAGFGGPNTIDLDLSILLAADDGDGVFDPALDAPLFTGEVLDLNAENGAIHEHMLGLPGGIVAPSDATIWFATTYATDETSFVSIGQGLYNDYTIGSSDGFVYLFDFANSSLQSFPQPQNDGVGAVLTVVPSPAGLAAFGALALCGRRRRL